MDSDISSLFIEICNYIIENEKTIFDVKISIKVYNWDYETDLTDNIRESLNHELHHAFNYVVRYGKKSKTKFLGKVRGTFKSGYLSKYKNFPYLKTFLDVFYLNLPEERNARMHEVGIKINEFKNLPQNDIIEQLNRFPMLRDFTKMATFYFGENDKTPMEIKQEFVDDFNYLIEVFAKENKLDKEDYNYPKDANKFFKFWGEKFHKNAQSLRMNVVKLIQKAKNLPLSENYNLTLDIYYLEILFAEEY